MENLVKELKENGFIGQYEFDEDTYQPNYKIYNEQGRYLGDFLLEKGFKKTEEVESNQTWTTFRHGDIRISHRSFYELPSARTWCASIMK